MNYEIEPNPSYVREIRKLENNDPASAEDTFNPLFSRIINNIEALFRGMIPRTGGTLTGDLTMGAKGDGGTHSIKFAENMEIIAKGLVDRPQIQIKGKKVILGGAGSDTAIIADGSFIVQNILQVEKRIQMNTSLYRNKSEVLQMNSWESIAGSYPYRYKLLVPNLQLSDYLDITIDKDSMEIAEKAQICPTVEENDGFAYIYAKNRPTGNISVRRKVMV